MVRLGQKEIPPRAMLAPMAGVADRAFREICVQWGAVYVVGEMASAKGLTMRGDKTRELLELSPKERPAAVQLFGSEPEVMAAAAREAEAFSPDAIDINMGCPVPKVAGNGCGSALMKDPQRCGEIVAAVKAAVPVPVTAKMRLGWDQEHKNVVEVARICQQAGADAVCVHGRTRDQMYAGKADWQAIRQVKEALSIPVIANGDVTDAFSAAKLLEETGCDLVMVGRGALGNPWVFRQINAYLSQEFRLIPPPGLAERILVIRRHIGLLCQYKGEVRGMREARKHVGWYLHGMRGAAEFRRRAGELTTLADLDRLLSDVYEKNQAQA